MLPLNRISTRLIGFKRYLLAGLCVICCGQILSRSTDVKRRGPSISVTTRLEVVPISTGNITPINRRMPNCTTVVQTASALFEPEIRLNLPKK